VAVSLSGCGFSLGGPTEGLVLSLESPPPVPHAVEDVVFRVHLVNTNSDSVLLDFHDGRQLSVRICSSGGWTVGRAPGDVITAPTTLSLAPHEHRVEELRFRGPWERVKPGTYLLVAELHSYAQPRTYGVLVVF